MLLVKHVYCFLCDNCYFLLSLSSFVNNAYHWHYHVSQQRTGHISEKTEFKTSASLLQRDDHLTSKSRRVRIDKDFMMRSPSYHCDAPAQIEHSEKRRNRWAAVIVGLSGVE